MDGDQHRHAAIWREPAHEIQNLDLAVQVERRGRLIHQQHFRIAGECLGDRHQLPLAARQFTEIAECEIGDVEAFSSRSISARSFSPTRHPAPWREARTMDS